jgi:hypothetical protein
MRHVARPGPLGRAPTTTSWDAANCPSDVPRLREQAILERPFAEGRSGRRRRRGWGVADFLTACVPIENSSSPMRASRPFGTAERAGSRSWNVSLQLGGPEMIRVARRLVEPIAIYNVPLDTLHGHLRPPGFQRDYVAGLKPLLVAHDHRRTALLSGPRPSTATVLL